MRSEYFANFENKQKVFNNTHVTLYSELISVSQWVLQFNFIILEIHDVIPGNWWLALELQGQDVVNQVRKTKAMKQTHPGWLTPFVYDTVAHEKEWIVSGEKMLPQRKRKK